MEENLKKSGSCAKRKRKCALCKYSSYVVQKENIPPRRLFKVPRKDDLKRDWEKALSVRFNENDVLCQAHFKLEDLQEFFDTPMSDGTIHRIRRGQVSLRENAIPVKSQSDANSTSISLDLADENMDCKTTVEHVQHVSVTCKGKNIVEHESRSHERTQIGNTNQMKMHIERTPIYTFQKLQSDVKKRKLPRKWSLGFGNRARIIIGEWDKLSYSEMKLVVDTDKSVQVYIKDVLRIVPGIRNVHLFQDIIYNLQILENIKPCCGVDNVISSEGCPGFLERTSRSERCIPCRIQRRRTVDRNNFRRKQAKLKATQKKVDKLRPLKEKLKRMKAKVTKFKENIMHVKNKCARIKEEKLDKNISELPLEQQAAVRACFQASKVKSPRGKRYDTTWIYECILMRIKNKGLYEHILERNILVVPTVQTLNSYINKMHSAYGFNLKIFETLKVKCSDLTELERRGNDTL